MFKWFRRNKKEEPTAPEQPPQEEARQEPASTEALEATVSPELVPGQEAPVPVSQKPPEEIRPASVPTIVELPVQAPARPGQTEEPAKAEEAEAVEEIEEAEEVEQACLPPAHPELSPQYTEPDEAQEAPAEGDVSAIPAETFINATEAGELPEDITAVPEVKKGFFARLRDRLSQTKASLVEKVRSAIRLHGKVDEELLEEIEMILIQSDVGVPTTQKIVERMRKEGRKQGTLTPDALLTLFKESIEEILHLNARRLNTAVAQPTIILMVGVNGTGKTTTIGKIAKQLTDQGKRVMMVAADTFRAAAIEQLAIWAQRSGSSLVRLEQGSDPAAVIYGALEQAKQEEPDVILIDTAGRLHTKANLMEELKKIVRVIRKHYTDAPHETILVLDATTGQNAINQVQIFHDVCTLTGLIMTKLDGTAKGGVLIACKDMYNLPILKIGIGEAAEDLRDFDPHEFVDALFSNGQGENGAAQG